MTKRNLQSRAKKAGVELTFKDEGVIARVKEPNIAIAYGEGDEDATDADGESYFELGAGNAALAAAEFWMGSLTDLPGVSIQRDVGEDFVASKDGKEIARDPDMEDLLTTLTEGGEDAGDEDEETDKGTVVPEKFKKLYAEVSKERGGVDCGDWLADQMAKFCLIPVKEGRKKTMTDLDRFEDICLANGVDKAKMAALRSGTPGWQGRFRMTGRNLLTPIVAAKGVLFVTAGHNAKEDHEVKAPRQWCLDNAPKPKTEKKSAAKASVPAKGGKKGEDAKPAKAPKAKAERKPRAKKEKAPA